MGLALKTLLAELETQRAGDPDAMAELELVAVRTLEVPLDITACRELRVLAHVFNGDQAELAAAVLRAALADIQEHLDDDLDLLAAHARRCIDS
ncbi:hypothetical protein KIF53_11410 [Chromobacterium subtsugae]|uniref:Uncharacterized protein n=1 Tax=Chromobacterium subtsugae TaxID=251747 RepID=A0ABS7FDU5_9NEIS|nr:MULTISPECIES: hypothetical protein [Chromobacterium]KUM02376.1 hypothetical protein Cv017_03270 [Chromobacterium subtsugae]KZE86819.1 hypothetical protein AWB61_13770 [Chromobacterium sp. F49]MBW7566933.1 hypothetical protein [Chromobacterium subtsugae]MBW8288237.1 hypothetical protein [Chromobacterium subtsugae]OBU86639.1 hypothetical protein MY55_10760 [Chromobacterium subtsugae]